MNALVIDNIEYEFPTDFKVKEWLPLTKVRNNPNMLIKLALNVPQDKIELMPEGTKSLMHQLLLSVMYPTYVKLNHVVNDCELSDLSKITLGEFIDLEVMIENLETNLPNILNLLYDTTKSEEMNISEVYGSIQYYLNWRKSLFTNYKNLFDTPNDDEEVVEYKPNKPHYTARVWLDIVMTLADGKFLNMDAVTDKPLIQSLNWLAWNKDKRIQEAEQLRKQLQ